MSTNDTSGNESNGIDYKDPETLRRLYWGEGMSTRDIGDAAGVTHNTIEYHMEKNGIERRDRVEASKEKRRSGYVTLSLNEECRYVLRSVCNGEKRKTSLARLVAVAEYGFDAVAGNIVHHKNGIPWDDRPSNLEPMERGKHTVHHHSGKDGLKGEDAGSSKLTDEQVGEILSLLGEEDMTQSDIADGYGVDSSTISAINTGKTWSHMDRPHPNA